VAEPAIAGLGVAAGVGIGAMALAALGVHPQPLFWALIGATLGMSLAPKAGTVRTAIVFACVVLASALLGTALAHEIVDDAKRQLITADVAALLLGAAFHPLLIAFLNGAPALLAGWISRFSAGGAPRVPPAQNEEPKR
jgi:hypothetical protein